MTDECDSLQRLGLRARGQELVRGDSGRFHVIRCEDGVEIWFDATDAVTCVGPFVERHTSVCGGEPCIVRTRIPIWVLEQSRRQGISEADLLRSYPTLRAEDLANAWTYVRAQPEEIERQIRNNEEA